MSAGRLNISLERYAVGISGAVPEQKYWSEPAMDRGILEFVALLSGIVIKYGGRVVHGCHPTFTPLILRQARLHGAGRKPVTLVMSNLWAKSLTPDDIASMEDVAEFVVTAQVGDGGPETPSTRNQSLTLMRKRIIDFQNVMVAVGGKMHIGDELTPGVLEEMQMAQHKGIPRFLVGGLGGYSKELAAKLTASDLKNGLTADQNRRLFGTSDVAACVNIIFERLATLAIHTETMPG
jgi:hypothetical protein